MWQKQPVYLIHAMDNDLGDFSTPEVWLESGMGRLLFYVGSARSPLWCAVRIGFGDEGFIGYCLR